MTKQIEFKQTEIGIIPETAIGTMTGSSGRQRVPEDLFNQLLICVPPQKIIEKFHKVMPLLFEKIANNAN